MHYKSSIYLNKKFLLILLIIYSTNVFTVTLTTPQLTFLEELENNNSNNDGLSVILMIGDGMGYDHVKLAHLAEVGKDGQLNMDKLPITADVTTHSMDDPITDSAAAATAFATGNKTNNQMLSVTPSGQVLPTILEYASEIEKSTGLVTGTEIIHATPAGFFAHVETRNDYSEIRRQLIEDANVDIYMGGGRGGFQSLDIAKIRSRGYTLIENRSQLSDIEEGKILGLFSPSAFPYEKDRDREIIPSLAEMTDKSLDILSQDPDGFFLMVEGGLIDWAGHNNNKVNDALETIEFDKAVEVAIDFVLNHDHTLLIVTADHETGGLSIISDTLNETLPSPLNSDEENEQLRIARINDINVQYSSTGHTGMKVPLYALGEGLLSYNNTTIDNTEIFSIMQNHLKSDTGAPSIFIDSPINETYETADIWLNVSLNETASWLAYSLGNPENVTMQNNSILLSFTEGTHHLIVYANDTFGNMASTDVYFTIDIPKTSSKKTPGFLLCSFLIGIAFYIISKKKIKSS